ncbi:MAG: flippase [Sinobacteraceae bacterium]|nr:flippase [Nevskiaceae bacterium]
MAMAESNVRRTFASIAANVGWLVADRVFRLGAGLLITVWIARHLGPEKFGEWNYAIAFATLFCNLATLGLDAIVVRDLVRDPSGTGRILGTAFALKFLAAALTAGLATAVVAVVRPQVPELRLLVALSAGAFVFQAANVVDFYFLAHMRSRYSVLAQNAAFVLLSLVRIAMLRAGAGISAFALANLVEAAVAAGFMIWIYNRTGGDIRQWRYHAAYARTALRSGAPLILAGLAVSIYMRIDQVMLGQMVGDKELGLYSAATRVSEAWYFVPIAIVNSFVPHLTQTHKHSHPDYLAATQKLYSGMFLLSACIAIVTALGANAVIELLYGESYRGAGTILALQIWAGIFVCQGLATGSALTTQGLQRLNMYRTTIGCISNVILNLFLIPPYGAKGAAVATVVSQGISAYSIGFFRSSRETFAMMLRAYDISRLFRRRVQNVHVR